MRFQIEHEVVPSPFLFYVPSLPSTLGQSRLGLAALVSDPRFFSPAGWTPAPPLPAPLAHSRSHQCSPRPAHGSMPLPRWNRTRVRCPELLDPKLALDQMWETQLPPLWPGSRVLGAEKERTEQVRGWGRKPTVLNARQGCCMEAGRAAGPGTRPRHPARILLRARSLLSPAQRALLLVHGLGW